jgi:hypothetical protein
MKNSKDSDVEEIKSGSIRHVHKPVRKGIEMLRLDRKMAPILDAWREAKTKNPEDWK